MTCWCSGILCGWCETVIALTGSLGLASHTAVTGARWTVRGFSNIILIVSVSPLCLIPFLIIYMETAELEPCVDIHNSGLYAQFGQRFHFAFFLTLCVKLQRTARNPVIKRSRKIQSKASQWCKTCSFQISVHDNKVFSSDGVVEIWCCWCAGSHIFITETHQMLIFDARRWCWACTCVTVFCRLCKIKHSWRKWFSTVQEAFNHWLKISRLAETHICSSTLHSTHTPKCVRVLMSVMFFG